MYLSHYIYIYKAPELFESNPEFSRASDMFAFGVVLWELISGEIPYSQRDDDDNLLVTREQVF